MAIFINKKEGQSLVEILIAVAVGAIIIASAAAALVTTVRGNQTNRTTDTASSLAQELMDNVRSYGEANWQDLYALTSKGDTTQPCTPYCYYLATGGSPFTLTNGSEATTSLKIDNIQYTRYFTIENVNRDNCGTGNITTNPSSGCTGQSTDILEDPSTQKITVRVTWPQAGGNMGDLKITGYATHYINQTSSFSDWSGGSGVEGPLTQPSSGYSSQSGLDTTTTPGSITVP